MVQIKKKTANIWQYKVGNIDNIANFVCLWKRRLVQVVTVSLPESRSNYQWPLVTLAHFLPSNIVMPRGARPAELELEFLHEFHRRPQPLYLLRWLTWFSLFICIWWVVTYVLICLFKVTNRGFLFVYFCRRKDSETQIRNSNWTN